MAQFLLNVFLHRRSEHVIRWQVQHVLGQQKLLKWTVPGVLHAFIFYAFIIHQTLTLEATRVSSETVDARNEEVSNQALQTTALTLFQALLTFALAVGLVGQSRRREKAKAIHRIETADRTYWAVTRYQDIVNIEGNAEVFKNGPMLTIGVPAQGGLRMIVGMDPPDHTRLRSLVSRAFTPRVVEGLRPRIVSCVGTTLIGTLCNWLLSWLGRRPRWEKCRSPQSSYTRARSWPPPDRSRYSMNSLLKFVMRCL